MRSGKGASGLPPVTALVTLGSGAAVRNAAIRGSVMRHPANRRTVLMAAGAVAVAAVAGTASAQSADISGTVEFEGGAVIPEGEIDIHVEGPAVEDDARRRTAKTRVRSDGTSRTIDFALSLPTSSTASPRTRIVARLERADGWLLARGSAQIGIDPPVTIVLHTAMY